MSSAIILDWALHSGTAINIGGDLSPPRAPRAAAKISRRVCGSKDAPLPQNQRLAGMGAAMPALARRLNPQARNGPGFWNANAGTRRLCPPGGRVCDANDYAFSEGTGRPGNGIQPNGDVAGIEKPIQL